MRQMTSSFDPRRVRGRATQIRLVLLLVAATGCGTLKQNLRNQFVSFRGAYQCREEGCKTAQMVRSTKTHREGDVNVSHVQLRPRAVLVFSPGTVVEGFTARVACRGRDADVPDERIKAPGTHGLKQEGESWLVIIDPADYEFGAQCDTFRVTTTATWDDGKATYQERAGIQVE